MSKVVVLPDHVASQIAAGEVVERPASVIKELVENSIDAGATQIEISINAGCRDLRVADNGCGMDADDAVLAFHRHATSKLASADDLWTLRSMGFRGEALPSIASIARVTCYTRTHEASAGTKIESSEGKVTAVETGCAPGTVMEVTDLFYSVPARLKFLKKTGTEFAHIHETVQSLAIALPKITFQLLNDGEVVFKTSGSGKLAQAMLEAGLLSGKEELCPVTYAELKHGMAIYGYIARPTVFRGDRKAVLSIVNNRPVRCPLTYKALEHAYSDLLPKGKHPIAVLTITADPREVDVNVHPTKKEIKYSNGNDVYLAIQRAVSDAIRAPEQPEAEANDADQPVAGEVKERPSYRTTGDITIPAAVESRVSETTASRSFNSRATTQMRIPERLGLVPPSSRAVPAISPSPLRTRATAILPEGWRLVGYVHDYYFVVETPEGIELLEQHIAHERVLYERILSSQETPGRISENAQRLVISVPLNLSPTQKSTVEQSSEALRKLGFEFEFQGSEQSVVVCTQVPLELAHKDYATAVQKIIESLSETEAAELELEATKSIACQAAVKNGMPLTEADIIQLISDWHKTPRNDTCPHGRPIRLKFSLEKLFQLFHPQ